MLLSEAIQSGSISSTGIFTAQCTNEHGDVVESSIDLNDFLGNENGAFKYDFDDKSGFYQNYSMSCESIRLAGTRLYAFLRSLYGTPRLSVIQLDSILAVHKGTVIKRTAPWTKPKKKREVANVKTFYGATVWWKVKENSVLSATCLDDDEDPIENDIDLNKILGNYGGYFGYGRDAFQGTKLGIAGADSHLIPMIQAQLPVGYTRGEVIGESNLDFLHLNDLLCVEDGVMRAILPEDSIKSPLSSCERCSDLHSSSNLPILEVDLPALSLHGCPTCTLLALSFKKFVPQGAFPVPNKHYSHGAACNLRYEIAPHDPKPWVLEFVYFSLSLDGTFKQHHINLMLYTESSSPYLGNSLHISGDSRSDSCISMIKSWISRCDSHRNCLPQTNVVPKRLVYVGLASLDDIRLVITQGEPVTYACLSHCWGKTESIKTTKATLPEYQQAIPWDQLPKVFRDAIEHCRLLDIKYVWIDSFCIIQDDRDDWQHEALQMASVYGGCCLCLAASSAKDHYGKCSVEEAQLLKVDGVDDSGASCTVFVRPARLRHIYDLPGVNFNNHFPLLTRAWVYQERALSSKVLHFGPEEVSFECAESSSCECGAIEKLLQFSASPRKNLVGQGRTYSDRNLWKFWTLVVQIYTKLDLSYGRDRLPAIAGVAKDFQERQLQAGSPLGSYLAGMWSGNLVNEMLWDSAEILPRPDTYVAPTWSWACIPGHIVYHTQIQRRWIAERFTILEAKTTTASGDPMDEITGGHLQVSGMLREMHWNTHLAGDTLETHLWPTGEQRPCMGSWHPDYNVSSSGPHQILSSETLYFLLVGLTEGLVGYRGLVLRKVGDSVIGPLPVFQRVGSFSRPSKWDVEDAKLTDLVIV